MLIFGIEGATRLFLPRLSALEVLVQPTVLRPNLEENINTSVFMADPLLFWRLRPNVKARIWNYTVVSTNAQGYRHNGNIGRKKPGAFRMVCLGDSVTFGHRVPLVFPEYLYPKYPDAYAPEFQPYALLLEKRLRETNPGKQIEIFPLAVPAYTSYQGLNWLRRDIDSLKPDVVTACFGWNDCGARALSDREVMPADWFHVTSRRVMMRSQALTHFSYWYHARKGKQSSPPPPAATRRVPLPEYLANFLEIARIARAHGAQPLWIGPIYRDSVEDPAEAALMKQYRDALRETAESKAVPYIEIQALAERNFPKNAELYGERIHPNGWGHQAAARELLQYFAKHETLKPLVVPQDL